MVDYTPDPELNAEIALRSAEAERDYFEAELREAQALIRWCYHDSEEMPPRYAGIIRAAKAHR